MAKVYARADSKGRVTGISSDMFVDALEGWVLIDEGDGDRYTLAQGNYLDGPLCGENGVYRYELADGKVKSRSEADMEADWAEMEAEAVAREEAAMLRENLLLLAATGSMTDEELFRYEEAIPRWTVRARYLRGQVLLYEVDGNLYKCQQNLDARAEHPPGSAGTDALYALVRRPVEPGGVLPWVYGEEVHPGDKRAYEGVVYERVMAWNPGTNIWEPPVAPTVWKRVEM